MFSHFFDYLSYFSLITLVPIVKPLGISYILTTSFHPEKLLKPSPKYRNINFIWVYLTNIH